MSLTQKLSDLSTLKALYQEVSRASSDADKLRAVRSFHDTFNARSAQLREAVQQQEQNQNTTLQAAERAAAAAEAEVAALEAQLSSLDDVEPAAASGSDLSLCPGKAYRQFLSKRAAVEAQLKIVRSVVEGVANGDAMKMQSDTDVTFCDEGGALQNKLQSLKSALSALNAETAALSRNFVPVSELSVSSIETELDAVSALTSTASQALTAYKVKKETVKDGVQEFDNERKRLLLWCRQQKTNLDAMTEPEHIQDFCASLLSNYPTMEENFNVLLEVAEPLLPNSDVQSALVETNEVWFHLQVSAFERLRQTLLEIHPKSKLEDEVREFSLYNRRVREFLDYFQRLLATPSDDESQSFVRPVVDQCRAISVNFPPHEPLTLQLREFAQRTEAMRESYSSFRRAVLSRLTFLATSAPALAASIQRKDEYMKRMGELKKWIDVKSQGESWRDIHQRVLAIRELIDKEQAALLSEKK
mmetsp:Transcript_33130/g.38554  ORF Transcript_33130/g.38554 Transcript_33130/m.38554 type:complete len:474 (-) Transcript_33130:82-1503(-)